MNMFLPIAWFYVTFCLFGVATGDSGQRLEVKGFNDSSPIRQNFSLHDFQGEYSRFMGFYSSNFPCPDFFEVKTNGMVMGGKIQIPLNDIAVNGATCTVHEMLTLAFEEKMTLEEVSQTFQMPSTATGILNLLRTLLLQIDGFYAGVLNGGTITCGGAILSSPTAILFTSDCEVFSQKLKIEHHGCPKIIFFRDSQRSCAYTGTRNTPVTSSVHTVTPTPEKRMAASPETDVPVESPSITLAPTQSSSEHPKRMQSSAGEPEPSMDKALPSRSQAPTGATASSRAPSAQAGTMTPSSSPLMKPSKSPLIGPAVAVNPSPSEPKHMDLMIPEHTTADEFEESLTFSQPPEATSTDQNAETMLGDSTTSPSTSPNTPTDSPPAQQRDRRFPSVLVPDTLGESGTLSNLLPTETPSVSSSPAQTKTTGNMSGPDKTKSSPSAAVGPLPGMGSQTEEVSLTTHTPHVPSPSSMEDSMPMNTASPSGEGISPTGQPQSDQVDSSVTPSPDSNKSGTREEPTTPSDVPNSEASMEPFSTSDPRKNRPQRGPASPPDFTRSEPPPEPTSTPGISETAVSTVPTSTPLPSRMAKPESPTMGPDTDLATPSAENREEAGTPIPTEDSETSVEPTIPSNSPSSSPSQTPSTPSGTPIPDGSSTCFPANARVKLGNGKEIAIHEVKVGDTVQVGSRKSSPVIAFSHQDLLVRASFVRLFTDSGHNITLTGTHYIHTLRGLQRADSIVTNDYLRLANGNGNRVTKTMRVEDQGLFNPQTLCGDIIVDGIRASTYTSAVQPTTAHALLAPVRLLRKAELSSELVLLLSANTGLVKLANSLFGQPHVAIAG